MQREAANRASAPAPSGGASADSTGRRRVARLVSRIAALLLLLGTTLLIADHLAGVRRAPAYAEDVELLEEQARREPAWAQVLEAVREEQTEASLARRARSRVVAWVLLSAAVAFLGAAKWRQASEPRSVPALDLLVSDRFGELSASTGISARASRGNEPQPQPGTDLSFVDRLVETFGHGPEAAVPILQAIQTHYRYLPDVVLERVIERTEITSAQIAGTSSFYAQFRRSPVGRNVVRVCHGTACHVAGAEQITQELRRHLEIGPGEDTDSQRRFTIDGVACLGCCSLAPVMMVEDETAGRLTPATACRTLDAVDPGR